MTGKLTVEQAVAQAVAVLRTKAVLPSMTDLAKQAGISRQHLYNKASEILEKEKAERPDPAISSTPATGVNEDASVPGARLSESALERE